VGKPRDDGWKTALEANGCKYARIFIPVLWTGEGNAQCKRDDKDPNVR